MGVFGKAGVWKGVVGGWMMLGNERECERFLGFLSDYWAKSLYLYKKTLIVSFGDAMSVWYWGEKYFCYLVGPTTVVLTFMLVNQPRYLVLPLTT